MTWSHVILFLVVLLPISFIAPKVISEQAPSNYQSPWEKQVLSFYYGWFGLVDTEYGPSHWSSSTHNVSNPDPANASRPHITSREFPTLGLYNSSDVNVVIQHQVWAEQAEIDAFICSWWGPGRSGDDNLFKQIEQAKLRDSPLKFCIDYETMIAVYAEDSAQKVIDDFTYIYDNFVDIPDSPFLLIDGKPVIYVYRADWLMPNEWRNALSGLAELGMEFFLVADLFPPIQDEFLNLFDGLHQYDTTQALRLGRNLPNMFESMAEIAHSKGKLYSACVLPGFNKTQLKQEPYFEIAREDGQVYRDQWAMAENANSDWVSIVSWSEWAEGTQIEPAHEYGDLYLNLTRELGNEWKQ